MKNENLEQAPAVNLAAIAANADMVAGAAVQESMPGPVPGANDGAAAIDTDYETEARGMIDFAAETAAGFFPALAGVYTEQTRAKLAKAWAPIMEMYGVTLGGVFSNPWVNAAFVTLPIAAQTYGAVKVQRLAEAVEGDERNVTNQNDKNDAPERVTVGD